MTHNYQTPQDIPEIVRKQKCLYSESLRRITEEYDRQKLTAEQLAEKAHVSVATVKRVLRGEMPSHSYFLQIVLALELSPRDIYPLPQNTPAEKLKLAGQLIAEARAEMMQ